MSVHKRIDEGFLRDVDRALVAICQKIDSGTSEGFRRAQRRAGKLCEMVADQTPLGKPHKRNPKKLLLRTWENDWKVEGGVYTYFFDFYEKSFNKQFRDSLYAAFCHLVRFVIDGTTDYLRSTIAQDSRRAIGEYLSLRGIQTESTRKERHSKSSLPKKREQSESRQRRGARGESPKVRFSEVSKLASELKAKRPSLPASQLKSMTRKAKQWLGFHTNKKGRNRWNDPYIDTGQTWWETLSEGQQANLINTRTWLLNRWNNLAQKRQKAAGTKKTICAAK